MTSGPKPVKEKRKKKKRPKSERQVLKQRLDEIVPSITKQRDGWQCVQCGDRQHPTNGHVIVRGVYGTRWDLLNQHCQCATCNMKHQHKPHLYISWFCKEFGYDMWEELNRRAEDKREPDWTVVEMRELLADYEDLYGRMQTLGVYDKSMLIAFGAYGQYCRNLPYKIPPDVQRG